MNRVTLVGTMAAHLGDTETTNHFDVHQFSLATVEKNPAAQDHVEYHPCVAFGSQAQEARDIKEGTVMVVQAAARWLPAPCLHVFILEAF